MGTRGTISCTPVLTRPAPLPTAAPGGRGGRRDALPAGRVPGAAHGRANRRRGGAARQGRRAPRAQAAWYHEEAGHAEVLWLVPGPAVEESLWDVISTVDPKAELMAVERLPAELLRYAGG
jgi:hypothetical protein